MANQEERQRPQTATPAMDAETFEALKVLMGKIDRHVRHASYQEDTKEAYSKVSEWMTRAGCQESEYES